MLRVWFSLIRFAPSEHDLKMTVPLQISARTSYTQWCVSWCMRERTTQKSIIVQLATELWTELFATNKCVNGSKCLKAAGQVSVKTCKDSHPHAEVKKKHGTPSSGDSW
jgi:hypothetical protein